MGNTTALSTLSERYRRIERAEGLLLEGEEQVFHMIERIVAHSRPRLRRNRPRFGEIRPHGLVGGAYEQGVRGFYMP
jgi:hypothetical protein